MYLFSFFSPSQVENKKIGHPQKHGLKYIIHTLLLLELKHWMTMMMLTLNLKWKR